MIRASLWRLWRTGTALTFASALLATGARAASSVATPAAEAGGVVVVLDCGGVTQQAVPDAEGKFVFSNAPQGECTVTAKENAPRDAASGMATGRRMHKPLRFQVTLDNHAAPAKAPAASEGATDGAVRVAVLGKAHELKGHVTLIK